MDSFEFNKIAGAVLGTLVFVLGMNFVSELIFHTEPPETPGYVIEVADAATGEAATEAEPEISIAALVGGGDAGKGESVAKKCVACHSFEQGGANKVGPNLWDVVGRKPASVAGFNYSAALKAFAEEHNWDFAQLSGFLENPKAHVPGTSMGFAGVKKADQRGDLLAYLRSLSDSPAPVPAE